MNEQQRLESARTILHDKSFAGISFERILEGRNSAVYKTWDENDKAIAAIKLYQKVDKNDGRTR